MKQINRIAILGMLVLVIAAGLTFSSCGSDLFIDPAGTCVTCTYEATATTAARTLEACADGEGFITVSESGETDVTSERSLLDFRLPHESSGAICR